MRNRLPSPHRQSGVALVELALVLTILLTLMAGMVEFGRAFWYYEVLTRATRDAARNMSVASKATIASSAVDAAKDSVRLAAQAEGLSDFTNGNVTVTCLTGTTYSAGACTDNVAPAGVKVEISNYKIRLGAWVPFIKPLASSDGWLAPSATMRYMN